MTKRKGRGGFRTGLAILGGTLLALSFLLEAAARALMPSSVAEHIVEHPLLNHVWKPNSSHVFEQSPDTGLPSYTRHYNAQSWIEKDDVPLAKPAGERRIFFLGDSFVEGVGPDETSMPRIVQRSLGSRVRVVNAGTSSYSPLLYRLLVDNIVLRYAPDTVVISIDMTDVFDDYLYRNSARFDSAGEIDAVPPDSEFARLYERTKYGLRRRTWFERSTLSLSEYSRFLQFVGVALSVRSRPASEQPGLFDWCTDEKQIGKMQPRTEESVRFSMNQLSRTIRSLTARGVRTIITTTPHLEQLTGEWSTAPLDIVASTARADGASYADTLAAFRQSGAEPSSLYLPKDMHFAPRGNEIWASSILESKL